jgi:NADPH oxidase
MGADNRAMLSRFFTPRKLIFHVFFWGFHWALFGIGWYGSPLAMYHHR